MAGASGRRDSRDAPADALSSLDVPPTAVGPGECAGGGAAPQPARPCGFDARVYDAVAAIPAGRLATYGQIAELIGAWGCARQVGWALRRLPLPSAIPWHRVVNAAGRIAMTPSREGSDWIQRELLLAEGIPVDLDGRLPLARFRWLPPCPWPEAAASASSSLAASSSSSSSLAAASDHAS